MKPLRLTIILFLLFAGAAASAQDYPDPTILKDGDDYYMTHSPFVYHPGLLIWHSTNLQDWEPVCRACPEFEGSGYAPEIIRHEGRYFIYFPSLNTNFVIWADDIRGPWSKPIDLKVGGIDPGHAVGEDGKRYLFLSNGNAPLVRVQLSDDGLSVVTEPEVAYEGWQFPSDWETEGFWLEAPKITRHGEYFYLTTAEGGTAGPATSHMVVSARSKSIFGPWENSPYNPIVHTYSADEPWWSKGHGTPVEGPDGKWKIVYHAYPNGFHTLGRVSIMEPLEWTEDGWFKSADPSDMTPLFCDNDLDDNFKGGKYGWQWTNWELSGRGALDKGLNLWMTTAQDKSYSLEVKLRVKDTEKAGMLLFYEERAFTGIIAGVDSIDVYSDANHCATIPNTFGRKFKVRIINDNNTVSIAARKSLFGKWTLIASGIDVSKMHHNTYAGFFALRPALVSSREFPQPFKRFRYVLGIPDGKVALPVAEISSGKIEGNYNAGIYSFKGIPYAKAERFQPSEPVDRWDGIRECKEFGPWAKQAENSGVSKEGDGDFLANVWTAGLGDKAARPIMVWIHGGGYSTGSGSAGPVDGSALARKGVVLVSINHRLDILGFLNLSSFGGKWEKSVNVGMLDIVEALKWVKKNAEVFGGDPDNITIFGESGGGGKVGTLLCMPEAEGLFQKAIIQSGAKVNITTSGISRQLGRNVVEGLGLTAETLDKIQDVEYDSLLKVGLRCQAEILGPRTPGSIKMWGYVPTEDGVILPRLPYNPGFSNLSLNVPVMIGSTFNELERTFYTGKIPDEAVTARILSQRFGDGADAFKDAFFEAFPDRSVADMLSIDSNIRTLSLTAADARSEDSEAPVYVFYLTWMSRNDVRGSGCYHGLDIPLAFNNPLDEGNVIRPGDSSAIVLADRMSDLWVNFARTGVPSAPGVPEWIPYTKENGATMILDNEISVKYNFDRELQDILYSNLK